MFRRVLIGAAGLLWVTASTHAQNCGDISALADGWGRLGAALSEHTRSGMTRAEAKEAETAFADSIAATRELATFLVRQDGPPVVLGSDLEEALDWFEQAPDLESVVGAARDMIEVLSQIIQRCEASKPGEDDADRRSGQRDRPCKGDTPG